MEPLTEQMESSNKRIFKVSFGSKRSIYKIFLNLAVIRSYNSFIFDFETSTFTWSFVAPEKIFDISRVISVTWKAMDN